MPNNNGSYLNEDWAVELAEPLGDDQMGQIVEGEATFSLTDELFSDSKRQSNLKIIRDIVLDKPAWTHTLKHKYPQIKGNLDMLDSRTRGQGCWARKRVRKKNGKMAGRIPKA